MSLEQAVLAYRNEYLLGNNFRRLKGPLSMRPFHLQREDRMAGMAHLLTIALRVMTLIEFAVRQSLQFFGLLYSVPQFIENLHNT